MPPILPLWMVLRSRDDECEPERMKLVNQGMLLLSERNWSWTMGFREEFLYNGYRHQAG
jgi:hypothetical protein